MKKIINETTRTRYEISQGCKKYSFDKLTQLVDAFTVNRYLDPNERFHLTVVTLTDTEHGTIRQPVTTIFEWIGVKAYWSHVFYG